MKTFERRRARKSSGFSLAELMVVIVIIGLLVGLVVPNVWKKLAKAKSGVVKSDLKAISLAIGDYKMNNAGQWPESLERLVTPDESGYTYLDMEIIPIDPWGNEYQYEPPGAGEQQPHIYSMGADGAIGGEGDDGDITYAMVRNREI